MTTNTRAASTEHSLPHRSLCATVILTWKQQEVDLTTASQYQGVPLSKAARALWPQAAPEPHGNAPTSRVVVLGGTGLIGSHIIARLLELEVPVSTLSRRPYTAPTGFSPLLRVVTGDVRNRHVLARALRGATDVVYAVSSGVPRQPSPRPMVDIEAALGPLLGVLHALRRSPHVRLFFLSSGGAVYGNPTALPVSEDVLAAPVSPYGVLKLAAENYIGMYGHIFAQQYCILRVGNVYGPRQPLPRGHGVVTTLLRAASGRTPVRIFGDGTELRDYIAADDVAAAFGALLLKSDLPPVINVGTGQGTSLNQLLTLVKQVTYWEPRVQYVNHHPFQVGSIVLNVHRLSTLIDFAPTPLEVGVERVWAQFGDGRHRRAHVAGGR